MRTIKFQIIFFLIVPMIMSAQNKYVGAKMCGMCHKGEKKGSQLEIWQKSKHAQAFKTLSSDTAIAIAKAQGLKKSPSESAECLECHVITSDVKIMQDGVQCETCHGPGSAYKSMAIMKDKVKAVAAGLVLYKDTTAIIKKCETCHNDKSPTFKEFDFKAMWAKIKHPIPKS